MPVISVILCIKLQVKTKSKTRRMTHRQERPGSCAGKGRVQGVPAAGPRADPSI